MMILDNRAGRANVSAGRGRIMANFTGQHRKMGRPLRRARAWVFVRDGFICQKCGKDCRAEYQAFLNGPQKGIKPPLVAAHIVPFKVNGLSGLNVRFEMVNGKPTVFLDDVKTANELRSCGFSEADIEATLSLDTYASDCDPNNLEAWCWNCNSSEADAIANERNTDVLIDRSDMMRRIARAYALNKRAE